MHSLLKLTAMIGCGATLIACGASDDGDTTNRIELPDTSKVEYHSITTNLQGTLFDAVTGNEITGASIVLTQGNDYRAASQSGADFYFSDIPTSVDGNSQFRLAASAEGYQKFVSVQNFNIHSETATELQDSEVNKVGNIYLFPIGMATPDLNITVSYNGEAIENAAVQLNPVIQETDTVSDASYRLLPTKGFLGSVTAMTDADGKVQFNGETLVLGGRYNIQVLTTEHEGYDLIQSSDNSVIVGTSGSAYQAVTMAHLVNNTDNSLYIMEASNADFHDVKATGVLTVTLNRAVQIVGENRAFATLTNANQAKLMSDAQGSQVTASVSADGHTITLTPNFETMPTHFNGTNNADADNGLEVSFSGVYVRMTNDSDDELYDLFELMSATGAAISNEVLVTPAF